MSIPISQALIEHLEQRFPNTMPLSWQIPYERLLFEMGQRSVVNYLKMVYDEQTKGV